jgi:replication protein
MAQCSTFLQLHPLNTADGRQQWMAHTHRCRERFCPICHICRLGVWKVRMRAALRILLTDYPDAVGLALTFTVRNCAIEDLRDTLGLGPSEMLPLLKIAG